MIGEQQGRIQKIWDLQQGNLELRLDPAINHLVDLEKVN